MQQCSPYSEFMFIIPNLMNQLTSKFFLLPAIPCPAPGIGMEATLNATGDTYHYQDVVNYACNNPAAMVTRGNLSLLCQANGQWSDEPPTCCK